MATAADLRELEPLCPWADASFRQSLQQLRESTAETARRFAADMQVLARLADQVPRCPGDGRGGTPWTSFRREVAVARALSDRAAEREIVCAQMLAEVLPKMRGLLETGAVTVQRARAFVDELLPYERELAGLIDAQLATRAAGLPAWRIAQEVRRLAATLDAEAHALRVASANASRDVTLTPDRDDQATAWITGPAVSVTRWYATLDARARALRADGDPRTLAQLRFDLATSTFPCETHAPADPTAGAAPASAAPAGGAAGRQVSPPDLAAEDLPGEDLPGDESEISAGLRPSFVEPAPADCRRSRPVQANIAVPVETSLGLSNEPGWLDGYGWLSAQTCRLLLVDAELRRVCLQSGTGQLVEVAERDVRPAPTPVALRQSLLDMVLDRAILTGSSPAVRQEDQHDPSPPLRELVALRDRFCDGPTGTRTPARKAQLDHETPYPHGPTAAWNLIARAARTHQLKHYGWTPLRTTTSTIWFSPAGQVVEVPRHQHAPPGIDPDGEAPAVLPDPDALAALDRAQLLQRDDEVRPWLPSSERQPTQWTWLEDDPPF